MGKLPLNARLNGRRYDPLEMIWKRSAKRMETFVQFPKCPAVRRWKMKFACLQSATNTKSGWARPSHIGRIKRKSVMAVQSHWTAETVDLMSKILPPLCLPLNYPFQS